MYGLDYQRHHIASPSSISHAQNHLCVSSAQPERASQICCADCLCVRHVTSIIMARSRVCSNAKRTVIEGTVWRMAERRLASANSIIPVNQFRIALARTFNTSRRIEIKLSQFRPIETSLAVVGDDDDDDDYITSKRCLIIIMCAVGGVATSPTYR